MRSKTWMGALLSLGFVGCTGEADRTPEPITLIRGALTGADVLGFEDPSGWSATAGTKQSTGVRVQGNAALAVSGAAYTELTSNALSTLSGRLSLRWENDQGLLRLLWEETGGPSVQEPTTRGFGTRTVLASIESQLGGEARFDWRSEGLLCRLSVPLSPALARPDSGAHQGGVIEKGSPERTVRSADA